MRRALRIGAGLGLALVVITCTERSLTGPGHPGSAAFNFSAWAAPTPGTPPVPIDSLEIILQGASDGSIALDRRFGFRPDTLKGDSLVVSLDLKQSPETLTISIRMYGGGIDWYRFTGTAQVTAGVTARPSITGQYVGTGANATRVVIRPADTTAVGGTSFPLRAIAFDAVGDSIAGVPTGYRLSDSTRGTVAYPTAYTATLTAARSLRDSAWVVAETPTHLKDSTRVHLVPQPAQLIKVAGDNQTGVVGGALGGPLVVRLLDALGGGFKGDSVRWSVSAGSATLSALVGVTDDTGYAVVHVTPTAVGSLSVLATAKALSGAIIGSPATFLAMAGSGGVKRVAISPKVDTVAYGAPVQFTATLYDSLGNVVTGSVLWSSTAPGVATVDGSGLATTLSGDSAKIIAASNGVADTARLYVRVLRSLGLTPADTVITAVGDSVRLRTAPLDNFGAPVTTGLKITFVSASPGVVQVDTAGKVRLIGPGNGVVLAKDSVAPGIIVQGSATLRVNQVTFGIVNNPKDSVVVGVSGQTQILATAIDSNGYLIPGQAFSWVTRPLGVTGGPIASVTSTGLVSGVALGTTYAVDTLVEGLKVFKDSTKVVVAAAPPKLLQWAFDSTAVGNGGNVSIALAVTAPPAAPLTISITSTDTTIAKASPNTVAIGTGASATSVTILGLKAGRAVLTATDASGLGYSSKQMVVGVVSTITFREIANPCCQQQYFYLNQNETHKAQVWLSDPAPAGGLGITFVYGRGLSAVTPSPAVIPAGQLSADITFQGLASGPQPDSVVPTSGGYIGKFSYVYVAPDSLRLNLPYPYNGIVGVGQTLQPTVSFTYAMDHQLLVSAALSLSRGVTQPIDTVRTGATSQSVTVIARAPGADTLGLSAPGWVAAKAALTFTTPHLGVGGTTSMIAGDPSHGSWTVYPEDSLRTVHNTADTVRAALVSRDTTVVAADSSAAKILPGTSSTSVYNALRGQPGAGGRSVWLVASASGYTSDSFLVSVQAPTLTLGLGYPYDGRIAVGTLFQNAGYVTIPYVRPDTFWVVFQHTRKNVVAGPDSAAIPKGLTTGYFNTRGDTLGGTDTMSVARATGYTLPPAVAFHVDSIHVRPNSYPSQLFTISAPQQVSAYAYDAVNQQARPLVAPLRVGVTVSDTALQLDSAAVTIPAGTYVSNYDTLRVRGVDTIGAYIRTSAPGSTADSVGPIKVLATPLTVAFGYPYSGYVGRGLELQSNYISIPAAAANTVTVVLQRFNPTKDSLTPATVLIPKGSNTSQVFTVVGLDSTGTDSMTAAAPGFVTARATITPSPVHIALSGVGTSHLTTEPPLTLAATTINRSTGVAQNAAAPDTFSVQSSDSTVIRIDSAATLGRGDSGWSVVASGQSSGAFRVRFVGSGTARIRISARGFSPDSSPLISVTGPSLHLYYTTVTTGLNQVFQGEFVYLDNPVTGSPLVVSLQRSDSTNPSQVFGLSTPSVTIPVGSSSSSSFEITGQNAGSALLIARASGYSQATATVPVGQPRLATNYTTLSLYVGAPPTPVTVYTQDQTGAYRIVASALTVGDTSSASGIVVGDSATFTIAALASSSSVGVRGLQKGSAALFFSAPSYRSDTLQVSVDTATLAVGSPPNGLGPGQTAQMSISIPFAASAAVTVNLSSSAPNVLAVPATVTIPANASSATFTVTGGSQGTANVGATATGFYAATLLPVAVGSPKLGLSLASNVIVGQKQVVTVYAEDANGTARNVATPLVVTLVSSLPSHASFDSSTITIPAGSYYVQTGVTFDSAATYAISATAANYAGASQPATATGALVTMIAPTTFSPAIVTIPAGQYVTWKNNDAINHTTTSDAGSTQPWDSGSLAPGATFLVYFPTPGTYTYHCAIHGTIMSGTVIVQ